MPKRCKLGAGSDDVPGPQPIRHSVTTSTSRRRRLAVPRPAPEVVVHVIETALVIGAVAGATAVVINVAGQVPRIA